VASNREGIYKNFEYDALADLEGKRKIDRVQENKEGSL
jgi:hypothetical protein